MRRDRRPQQMGLVDEVDRGPFWAYLRVTSHRSRLAEISDVIGFAPDRCHEIGDANPYRGGDSYKWSKWIMYLEMREEFRAGAEGLSDAIEALSNDFADRLSKLANRFCEVQLMVVQELEYEKDKGIHLTAEAVRWMSRAGASLDIDQYVLSRPRRAWRWR